MKKSSSTKGNPKNRTASLKKTEELPPEQDNEFVPPPEKGENVRVAIRIRPMNEGESARGDAGCLNAENESTLSIAQK
jgi:hypothetical protein